MLFENSINGILRSISDETRMNNPSEIPRAKEDLDNLFEIMSNFYAYILKDF